MTSHYDVLGVGVDADLEEVRRAYYREAQLRHPDRYAGSSPEDQRRAEAEMKTVNAAWNTLRNSEARRRYDIELGLIAGDGDVEAPEVDGPSDAEPHHPPSAFRRGRVPLVISLVLIAGILASGIAMVFQADNPFPRWSSSEAAELRSAAINAGMTAPQADCFVKAFKSRYAPTDNVDWALAQQFVDACR